MDSIIPTAEEIFLIIEECSKPKVEKHVKFASNSDTFFPNSDQNLYNSKDCWYQREEIGLFKTRVQEFTAAAIRGENPKTDQNGSSRGLEHYCDLNRMRRKQMAVSHILSMQGTLKGLHLARVAQECSTWHRDIAFIQGLHDYCDVYNPAMAGSVPKMPASPTDCPYAFDATRKRCAPPALLINSKRRRTSSRLTAE